MIGYRVSSYDTPCPPSPSRRASRWAAAGTPVASYWSLHPHGAWAELYRGQGLHEPDAVLRHVATRLWVGRFPELEPLDVTAAVAQSHGLSQADLISDDWTACQRTGARLREDGHTALLVPSAALPGTRNLVLFGQRLAIPYDDDPLDEVDLPCAVAADRSPGVASVLPSVRHRGARRDEPYRHALPDPLP